MNKDNLELDRLELIYLVLQLKNDQKERLKLILKTISYIELENINTDNLNDMLKLIKKEDINWITELVKRTLINNKKNL